MSDNDITEGLQRKCYACELTIVVPVYCNAESLVTLVERLHRALEEVAPDHRILMVDDASPDASWAVLRRICEFDDRVDAVRLQANAGQHRALISGLSLSNSPWVAIMDADLQDPPELLPVMLSKARHTGATVFGERHGQYESWDRMLTSLVYKTGLRWLTGVPRRCGTFFLASKEVVDTMLGYSIPDPQAIVMAGIASSSLATVPFMRVQRPAGKSAYNFRSRIKAAWCGYLSAFYCRLAAAGRTSPAPLQVATIAERLGRQW